MEVATAAGKPAAVAGNTAATAAGAGVGVGVAEVWMGL